MENKISSFKKGDIISISYDGRLFKNDIRHTNTIIGKLKEDICLDKIFVPILLDFSYDYSDEGYTWLSYYQKFPSKPNEDKIMLATKEEIETYNKIRKLLLHPLVVGHPYHTIYIKDLIKKLDANQ